MSMSQLAHLHIVKLGRFFASVIIVKGQSGYKRMILQPWDELQMNNLQNPNGKNGCQMTENQAFLKRNHASDNFHNINNNWHAGNICSNDNILSAVTFTRHVSISGWYYENLGVLLHNSTNYGPRVNTVKTNKYKK